MPRHAIEVPSSHEELGAYSHIVDDGRGTLYVSGQIPVDEAGSFIGSDDIRVQSRQTLENLRAALDAAGVTTNDVVKLTTYLVDADDISGLASVRSEFFEPPFPASSVVIVAALLDARWRVEIDAVAVRG